MRCSEARNILDEHLDDALAWRSRREVEYHLERCEACRDELAERRNLRRLLAQMPAPEPSEAYFDQAIAQAAQVRSRRRSDRITKGAAPAPRRLALAAALVCAIAGGLWLQQADLSSATVPETTIAMHEVTPVNLVFWSDRALADTRLSIQLPEGIELAGYNERSALTWKTDLEAGRNLLRLPLVGHVAAADEVTATLEHPQGTKTFRLKVKVI